MHLGCGESSSLASLSENGNLYQHLEFILADSLKVFMPSPYGLCIILFGIHLREKISKYLYKNLDAILHHFHNQ